MATPPPQDEQPQGQAGPGPQPGQRPTPEQIQQVQRKIAEDAQKAGMSVPDFIEHIKKQAQQKAMASRMAQQQQGAQPGAPQNPQQGGPGPAGQRQPITPGPPKPEALAVAKFLRKSDLKMRTCILNGERKDLFKVKRAIRALQSEDYQKARKKDPLLPEVKDRVTAENVFKLLPLSMLALRVTKIEPAAGANGKKPKRVKGQWNVKIEQQQEANDEFYYAFLWSGDQTRQKLYAFLVLLAIFAVVLYPLWPIKLRLGVYYLSWGLLGVLGLFFLMAIFRVILFCVTYFAVPPGLWLYPNLWEDVSFFDSFRPVWAWHETTKPKKKKKAKSSATGTGSNPAFAAATGQVDSSATTTGTDTQVNTGAQQRAYEAPKVEELAEDE